MEGVIINATLRNTGTGLPVAQPYLSLHTADPTDTGASELPVASNYARTAIAFDAPTDGVTQNSNVESFTATGGNWGQVVGFGIWDASAAGNLLYHGTLTTPRTINDGDTLTFAAGAITITVA